MTMVSATSSSSSGQWQENNDDLVSHQTEINAPIHVVWEELIDIKNWPSWNVWTRVDDDDEEEEEDDSTLSASSRTNDRSDNSNNINKRLVRRRSSRSRRRRSGRIEEGVSGTMKLKLTTSSPKKKNSKWTKSTSFVFTDVSKPDHHISWMTTSSPSVSSPSSPKNQPPTTINPLLSRVVVVATGGCNMKKKKQPPRRRVIHNIKLDSIDCKTTLLTHTKEIQGTGRNGLLLGKLPTTFQKLGFLSSKTGLGGGGRRRPFSCGIFSFDAMHRNCVLMDTELKYHVERIHFCSLVESISTRSFTMTDLGSSSISSCLGQQQQAGGRGGGGGTEFGCTNGGISGLSASKNVLLNPTTTTCDARALNNSAYWDTPKSIRNIIVSSYLQPSDHSSSSSSSSSDSIPVIGTVAAGE